MAEYLLDTNALITWFNKREGCKRLEELLEHYENKFFTSIICITEFLVGCSTNDGILLNKIIESGDIEVLPFNSVSQAECAAQLRKQLGLKTPDAIITAAAIDRNLILVTFDLELMKKIKDEVKLYPR